jgi:hypothetical protein
MTNHFRKLRVVLLVSLSLWALIVLIVELLF